MLHYRLCGVTAQVAARWSDLEKKLMVSAGTGCPWEFCLIYSALLPKGGRGV